MAPRGAEAARRLRGAARPGPPSQPRLSLSVNRLRKGVIAGLVIGLVALLASHTIWPGILLLLGLTNLVHQAARGRPDHGLRALLWLGGLTLLLATKTLWPGILILIFISMALGGGRSRHARSSVRMIRPTARRRRARAARG